MAHVAKTHVAFLLRLVRRPLAVKYTVCDILGGDKTRRLGILPLLEVDRAEKVQSQSSVVAPVQGAVEDLLDDVVDDVVEKVVPRVGEKERLS